MEINIFFPRDAVLFCAASEKPKAQPSNFFHRSLVRADAAEDEADDLGGEAPQGQEQRNLEDTAAGVWRGRLTLTRFEALFRSSF